MRSIDPRFYRLQNAVEAGHLKEAETLLAAGVPPDPYQDGRLLDVALGLAGEIALDMMYLLIRRDELYPYLDQIFEKSLYGQNLEMAAYLAEAGAVTDPDEYLAHAVFTDRHNLAAFVLDLGANPDMEVRGLPLLYYARDDDMTALLLKAGASTRHPVFRQRNVNPLIYAENQRRAQDLYRLSMYSDALPPEMMLPIFASASNFDERTALGFR